MGPKTDANCIIADDDVEMSNIEFCFARSNMQMHKNRAEMKIEKNLNLKKPQPMIHPITSNIENTRNWIDRKKVSNSPTAVASMAL